MRRPQSSPYRWIWRLPASLPRAVQRTPNNEAPSAKPSSPPHQHGAVPERPDLPCADQLYFARLRIGAVEPPVEVGAVLVDLLVEPLCERAPHDAGRVEVGVLLTPDPEIRRPAGLPPGLDERRVLRLVPLLRRRIEPIPGELV